MESVGDDERVAVGRHAGAGDAHRLRTSRMHETTSARLTERKNIPGWQRRRIHGLCAASLCTQLL